MYFVYIIVGVLVVLPLAQWLILVVKLYGTKLTQVKFKPLASVKLPQATQQQFNYAQAELESLGFQFFHLHAYRDLIASNTKPVVQLVMRNEEYQCYAVIANPHNPDFTRPYAIKFQSFSKQLTIEAMDGGAEGVIKSFDQLHALNYQATALQDAFAEFLSTRKELTEEKDLTVLYFQKAESYCLHMQQCYDRYLRYLYQNGMVQKSKGTLQLHFFEAVKLAWQISLGAKKATITKPETVGQLSKRYPFLPAVQAQAHRKLQHNQQSSQLNRWGKTILFFVSALTFALLFGIAWSPFLVLILIPVLLFHEVGHFLAMKMFGYRDLQILFLPIGAMVSGNKQQPSAMQRIVVSLAGPVPGLLLAFALAVWAPDFIYNEYGIALVFMLLIINYLNLLPFMPLDGGHVVNLLLFDRWPVFQFVLMLISVLMFALGAWFWSDPILTVLAVVFGMGLKNHYQQAQYVINARKCWGDKLKNRDNLAVVYHLMKNNPAPFVSKFQEATPINDRLSHPSPSLRDSLLGMAMYLSALIAPLLVVEKVIGIDLLSLLFSSTQSSVQYDPQQWEPDYWQTQYNNATTLNQKKRVLNDALVYLNDTDYYYALADISSAAIELFEANQWQDDPDYAIWLKSEMLFQLSENYEYDVQPGLNKLADVLGEESIDYTEVLVEVSAWQSLPKIKDQLLPRLSQLATNQKYDILLSALAVLQVSYEEEQQMAAYERLISGYLKLFKTQAPELYPSLREYFYQALFIQGKYPQILDTAQQDAAMFSTEGYLDAYELEMLAWAALLDHQYGLAKAYQQSRLQAEQQQQQELKDEIGFFGGLVLDDQISAMSLNQDPLFDLALAVEQGQHAQIAEKLDAYIAFIENWRKQSFDEFLEQIRTFDDVDSKQLHYIKYQLLFQAIRSIRPNLLTVKLLNKQ